MAAGMISRNGNHVKCASAIAPRSSANTFHGEASEERADAGCRSRARCTRVSPSARTPRATPGGARTPSCATPRAPGDGGAPTRSACARALPPPAAPAGPRATPATHSRRTAPAPRAARPTTASAAGRGRGGGARSRPPDRCWRGTAGGTRSDGPRATGVEAGVRHVDAVAEATGVAELGEEPAADDAQPRRGVAEPEHRDVAELETGPLEVAASRASPRCARRGSRPSTTVGATCPCSWCMPITSTRSSPSSACVIVPAAKAETTGSWENAGHERGGEVGQRRRTALHAPVPAVQPGRVEHVLQARPGTTTVRQATRW